MCILVIEDEPLIRMLVVEELAAFGREMREASNGDQAAHLIGDPAISFCLLITDIHMAGRHDGFVVGELMRGSHPSTPIVYMTARPDIFQSKGYLRKSDRLLTKPFSLARLIQTVDQLLAKGQTTLFS